MYNVFFLQIVFISLTLPNRAKKCNCVKNKLMRNMKYLIKLVKLKEIIEIASGEKCEQNYIDTKLNVNK